MSHVLRNVAPAFAVTFALTFASCKSDPPPPAPAPTAPPPTPAAEAAGGEEAPAAAGKGSLRGAVAFTGAAPKREFLKRDTDPICAKTKVKDEQVIVNPNQTLKNVLIRVKGVKGKFETPTEEVVISQKDCMYTPRVAGAHAGQPVLIKNDDPTMHNVHTYRGSKTVFNQAMPPPALTELKKNFKAGDPDIVKWKCDVHPWMSAYLYVSTDPFFAVTSNDGAFEIKDVPAGKYSVEAWHEKYGSKTVEVEVKADSEAEAAFEYSGAEQG